MFPRNLLSARGRPFQQRSHLPLPVSRLIFVYGTSKKRKKGRNLLAVDDDRDVAQLGSETEDDLLALRELLAQTVEFDVSVGGGDAGLTSCDTRMAGMRHV